MKSFHKIFATAVAATVISQSFAMCVLADTVASVSYEFSTDSVGIADGTITVSGIPSDAAYVKLYWGGSENTPLEAYSPIKNYTSSETVDHHENALELTDGSISYTVEGNRYLPSEAKYIIAEITNADGTLTTVSQELTNTGFSEDDDHYSMFWVSDVHIRWLSWKEASNQSKAFKIMRQVADKDGEKFKGVIMNGDLANSSYDYEWGLLAEMIDKHFGDDYPVYYNIGNHDQYELDNAKTAFNNYFDKMDGMGYTFEKTDEWSYDTYINGHHYIFWATPYNWPGSYKDWTISQSQYEWLEAKLSEGDRAGAKNYVFTHLVAKDTTPGSGGASAFNKTEGDTEFAAIMERHPHTVVVTSHVHLDMDTDMKTLLSNRDTPSYMDTSSLYYTNTHIPSYVNDINHAYGRYVRIYDDKIVVQTMNFQTNKWVPRAEYVIPVNNTVTFNGDVSISNSGEGLAVGNVLTAKIDGNDVDTDKYSCEWFVSSIGNVGNDITYTIATADKNVSLKIMDKETGAYAYATTGVYSYTEPETPSETPSLTPPVMTNDNTVVENDGVIMVTGNVGSANAGKKVLLVIAPQSSFNDLSTAKYINEVTVGADGSYIFKFKADGVNEDDVLMAKLDGKDITNSIITVKGANEFGVDMTLTLSSANVPSMSIVNKYLDATENIKAVIATYDADGKLIKANTADWDMVFGAYGETQKYSLSKAVEGASVKAFLFSDLTTLKPLSASDTAQIPVIVVE